MKFNLKISISEIQYKITKITLIILVLPYAGSKGEKLIKPIKNSLKFVLPENVTTRVTNSGTKLTSKFTKMKDKTVKEHQHDIVYMLNVQKVRVQSRYLPTQCLNFFPHSALLNANRSNVLKKYKYLRFQISQIKNKLSAISV